MKWRAKTNSIVLALATIIASPLVVLNYFICGIKSHDTHAYWKSFAKLAVFSLLLPIIYFLFEAGGTAEDPTGDGIITRLLRPYGPLVLVGLIPFIAYWIGFYNFAKKIENTAAETTEKA